MKKHVPLLIIAAVFLLGVYFIINPSNKSTDKDADLSERIIAGELDNNKLMPDEEWKKLLNAEQYHILREKGTEVPFTGKLLGEKRKGTYYSAGCDEPVFHSDQKYDSGTGWPSFTEPISSEAVVLAEDNSLLGQSRIEVMDRCGGHLGHVFNDGPHPSGKRYCINSAALVFVPGEDN